MTDVTYPPLDVLKPVADDIWIVDSGPLKAAGVIPIPVRMTVVRLANGEVLLHSPTRFTPQLRTAIEAIGPLRHLVAPNVVHWTFLKEWQGACPDALVWAAKGLRERGEVKSSGLRIDRDIPAEPPPEWAGSLAYITLEGAMGFREIAFLHGASRTLILTDLAANLEPGKLPLPMRLPTWLMGMTEPDGKASPFVRLSLRARRAEASTRARQLIAWAPERVIFSHGRWFERDGTAHLQRSLGWLLG